MRRLRASVSASLVVVACVVSGCAYESPTAPSPSAQEPAARVPARIAIQLLTLETHTDIRADVFTADNLTVPGVAVQFATTAGTLTTTTATTDTVGVAYTRVAGVENATVTITAGTITTTTGITRSSAPFTFSLSAGPQSPKTGDTVAFNVNGAQATAPATYEWNFGDGAVASGTAASASHRYVREGTLTATVTIVDAAGRTGSASTRVRVSDPPTAPAPPVVPTPVAALGLTLTCTAKPAMSETSCNVAASWDGVALPSRAITSAEWDFGDGSWQSTGRTPVVAHFYTLAGSYTVFVTVRVTTDAGEKSGRTSALVLVQ